MKKEKIVRIIESVFENIGRDTSESEIESMCDILEGEGVIDIEEEDDSDIKKVIADYQECEERLEDLSMTLYARALEITRWKEENLGIKKMIHGSLDKVEIDSEHVHFSTHESWAYGGYEEYEYSVSRKEMESDDWKDGMLAEHNKKLEAERKKQEEADRIAAMKKEENERAEYERLRAKYEAERINEDLVREIYSKAISSVFTEATLTSDGFIDACYMQMIDDTHSIVIWGNGGSDGNTTYRNYVISIRDGASIDNMAGKSELFCDETPNNSHVDLFAGIESKMKAYFHMKG